MKVFFLFCFLNTIFHSIFGKKERKISKTILWKKNFMLRLQQLLFFFFMNLQFFFMYLQLLHYLSGYTKLNIYITTRTIHNNIFNTPSLYLLFVDLIFFLVWIDFLPHSRNFKITVFCNGAVWLGNFRGES